ncbi:4,5-dihydroxyphthalate decarboxylase [Lutibacter agarilyticus]|uniref:4,5-dihydroxyphthalate decarboxylase n=1 Tax=Lutibacter agarilyticus TaxID=1109740 RepID=A0A238VH48_9FLAO|nr:ABC transporter substrate-binding protein [Lutibacter agarilyticus]SNR33566.1 4,5-dihydroxyphthalate decarboxylase [Lutibacter agarilyticus]
MKTKHSGRRDFLKKTALSAGAISVFSLSSFTEYKAEENNEIIGLPLKIAGYDVDRLKALATGKVEIEGCSFTFKKDAIGDINTNVFSGPQDYDVCEIGLHPFMLAYANEGFRDYQLLPIFPLRVFRHKSVFVRTDSGITSPKQLIGKKVGTPGYSSTSLTWMRGIFQDEYGLKPEDVEWIMSNEDSSKDTAGNISKQEQVAPDGITVKLGPAGQDESDLLLSGEIDALFHAAEPKAYAQGNPNVRRLFPNSRKTEQDYFQKTGVFPMMHAVAIRKSLIEKNPWLVEAVFNAYSTSKIMDFSFMTKLGWAYSSLPWFAQEFEETKKVMGANYWPYGIESNKKALENLFRYSYEQGLSKNLLTINDLFVSSSLNLKEK